MPGQGQAVAAPACFYNPHAVGDEIIEESRYHVGHALNQLRDMADIDRRARSELAHELVTVLPTPRSEANRPVTFDQLLKGNDGAEHSAAEREKSCT
jgi:hypothetical protein